MKFTRDVTTLRTLLSRHGIEATSEAVRARMTDLRHNRQEAASDMDYVILGWLDADSA